MPKNMCQSCGMPMNQDPKGCGTNADGSLNSEYCSYCFKDGKFTWTDATAAQMTSFCKTKLREMGYGRIKSWLFTAGIKNLKRWKQPVSK